MSSTDLAEIQAVVDGGLEKAGFMDSAPDVQFVASLAAVSVLSRRVMMSHSGKASTRSLS
jgi:hypothetical protein